MKDKILKIINAAWFPGILIVLALAIFTLLVFFQPSTTANTATGTLTVTVTGFRNNKGNVIVCLYKAGPLTETKNIADVREMSITGDKVTVVFADIPFQEYAIFVLHDENKNKIPEPAVDDVPLEGMGISNGKIVPPDTPEFDKAKFYFNQNSQEIQVPVIYW